MLSNTAVRSANLRRPPGRGISRIPISWGITSVATTMLAADWIAANVLAANLKTPPREGLLKKLTPVQQRALDQFAKSLPALGDNALIDTYHQAWEDHRAACAEGSDNLSKASTRSDCN